MNGSQLKRVKLPVYPSESTLVNVEKKAGFKCLSQAF